MSGGDDLFEVDPAAVVKPETAPTVAVKKTFRAFVPDQMLMLPPSPDEWLPEGHLARCVAELVDEVLDLGPILASYTENRGFPPYDPRLMVRLLIYGYPAGVRLPRHRHRHLEPTPAPPVIRRTESTRTPSALGAGSGQQRPCRHRARNRRRSSEVAGEG